MTRQIAILAFGTAALGFAATTQVPFQVNVDGTYVATSARLVLPFESIDKPLGAWAPAKGQAADTAFLGLLKAIESGNATVASKLFKSTPPASVPNTGVQLQQLTPQQFVAMYRQTFTPFSEVRILGRIPLGSGEFLYVWQGTTAKGPLVRSFRSNGSGAAVTFSEVTSLSPLESFMTNTLGRVPRQQWTSGDPEPSMLRLPIARQLGIYLLLPSGEPAERRTAAMELFGQFTALALAGKLGDLAGLATPASAKRLSGWAATVPASERASFQAYLGERRRVLRVASMGSVDLVFWVYAKLDRPESADLQYSYIAWSVQGPRIANILFQGIFDDILKQNSEIAQWCGIRGEPTADSAAATSTRTGAQ